MGQALARSDKLEILRSAIDQIRFPKKYNPCANNNLGWPICEICNNVHEGGCTPNELEGRLKEIIEIAQEALEKVEEES